MCCSNWRQQLELGTASLRGVATACMVLHGSADKGTWPRVQAVGPERGAGVAVGAAPAGQEAPSAGGNWPRSRRRLLHALKHLQGGVRCSTSLTTAAVAQAQPGCTCAGLLLAMALACNQRHCQA
jgi:hypothetical protein